MTGQYLTLSPPAPSESSHHTYHTYHAFVWVNRESFAKRTLLDMHMLYCSTHIFHCNTASPDVRAVGLPESIPDSLRANVHFALTPTHNLESPIRRLMVFGLWEEPPCRVSALYLSISNDDSASQVTVATSQIKHLQFSSLYSSYWVLSNCQVNQSLSHTPFKHIPHTGGVTCFSMVWCCRLKPSPVS